MQMTSLLQPKANHLKTWKRILNLNVTLNAMEEYFNNNYLKPNPVKTKITGFHLWNRNTEWKLRVNWQGIGEEPKYLGIKLDQALTFWSHCQNTKIKISTRNCTLHTETGKLSLGCRPSSLKTTALALCYSTGEYVCTVWKNSTHAKKVDALNIPNQ